MTAAVVKVVETRAMLHALGPRPPAGDVDHAKNAIRVIDDHLQHQLNLIAAQHLISPANSKANQEREARDAAEREKLPYKSVIQLDELHDLYENMLKNAESPVGNGLDCPMSPMRPLYITEDVDAGLLTELQEVYERRSVNLSIKGRHISHLPNIFGRLTSLITVDFSGNSLETLPESISELVNLLRFDVSSNQIRALPDSIGRLRKLKVLNVSGNMLKSLPESIGQCSSLTDLNAGFNQIDKLPSTIGHLQNLEKLSLQLNKLSVLPASICDLGALEHLEIQFNKLISLPAGIGNLESLKILNASSNFNNLTSLPSSFGNLYSLTELDISYNQIKELPANFGRLQSLKKLKVDQNPLIIPPSEVTEHSVEAVLEYMAEKWKSDMILDEEEPSTPARFWSSPWHKASASPAPAPAKYGASPSPSPRRGRKSGGHSHSQGRGSFLAGLLGDMCGRPASIFHRPSSKVLSYRSPDGYYD